MKNFWAAVVTGDGRLCQEAGELSAERDALEQVSVYLKARSTMLDNELDEDAVITISTGILRVTDTKFSIEDDAAGLLVKAFVTAAIVEAAVQMFDFEAST